MEFDVATRREGETLHVEARGELTGSTAPELMRAVEAALGEGGAGRLHLDLAAVDTMNTAGLAAVLELVRRGRAAGLALDLRGLKRDQLELLGMVEPGTLLDPPPRDCRKCTSLLEKIGTAAVDIAGDARNMVAFVGDLAVEVVQTLAHPRRLRLAEVLFYMETGGVDALPIVGLLALLLGLILGFQSAIQLRQFGANIYVADLVGVAITRELGPLMASIIVAGRSGSAFAAEIGTMKVSDEVSALKTMGFDLTRFLVMPKVLALAIVLPALALIADLAGILGGLIVGVGQLDIPLTGYLHETRLAVSLSDILTGLAKSLVFAILIAGVGCFRGLQVSGDAESVGRSTTSAVVSAIFLIVAFDAGFTILFYSLGF